MKKDKIINLCYDTLMKTPACSLVDYQTNGIEFKIDTNTLHLCHLSISTSNEYSLKVDTMPNKLFLFDKKEELINFFEKDLQLTFSDKFNENLKKYKKATNKQAHKMS